MKILDTKGTEELKINNSIELATDSGNSMLGDAVANLRPKAQWANPEASALAEQRDFTPAHELVEKLLVKILGQMGIQRPEDTAKEWIAECRK